MQQGVAWFRQRSRIAQIGVGVGAVVVLCCMCSLVSVAITGGRAQTAVFPTLAPTTAPTAPPIASTATAAPTSAPTAAPTDAPTATPAPTATTAPPTPEPPTVTPEGLSADDRATLQVLQVYIGDMANALTTAGALLQAPETSNTWRSNLAAQLVTIKETHKAIALLPVSAKLRPLHNQIVAATKDCNTAVDELVKGIDESDTGALRTATRLMVSCGEKMGRAAPQIEALKD